MTRSDRIREAVRITDLLSELGYGVQPVEREQQFGCDLHGTRDSKPSARVYPSSNSWYCFACGKSRDVIRTVMDKNDLDFKKAMSWLEKTYKLTTYSGARDEETVSLPDALRATFAEPDGNSYERAAAQVRSLLDSQRHDKALTCHRTMSLWESYDEIHSRAETDPDGSKASMASLREAVLKGIKDAARVP